MVKIKPQTVDTSIGYIVLVYHIGGTIAAGGRPWHGVYWYHQETVPAIYPASYLDVPDIAQAEQLARLYVAWPELSRRTCGLCWDTDIFNLFTPHLPQFNIMHGQTHERVIPCILWDFFNEEPPPGFTWSGT